MGTARGSRLVCPLPRSTVVVDPYAPNPQDSPLPPTGSTPTSSSTTRSSGWEAALRELREQLAELSTVSSELPTEELYESLAREPSGSCISAALREGRDAGEAALREQSRRTVKIPGPRA